MSRWDRVTELFEQALDLPAEQRSTFLERHCADDAALRTEVDSLLDAYAPARSYFNELESDVIVPSLEGLIGARPTLAPGTVVGGYEIEATIGEGGMGIVYRAHDRRLDRIVALKFIAPELTHDAGARARLIREARAAAALDHPRICTIHAIEQAPDGRLFLVMPHYSGATLKQHLIDAPPDIGRAIEIAADVADGLSFAHRAGIVHRDIKPANVLLTDDGAVKVLDFGIARLTTAAASTRSGTTIGTLAYISPEQARGEAADARSDIWSLGVVLYEMLAGRRPFQGDTEAAVLYAVLEAEPARIRTHVERLPATLEQLLGRMLSKDPAARPADAGAVADALREIRADRPADVRRAPGREAAPAVARRERMRPRGFLGRRIRGGRIRHMTWAAVVAGVLGFLTFEATRRTAEPRTGSAGIAVLPFVVRGDTELAYLRDGMVHLLSTKLDGIGDLRAVDPHALLAVFGSEDGAPDPAMGRAAVERFDARAFVLGAVLRLGSGIELSASLYSPSGELEATASAMAKQEADLPIAIDELVRALVAHELTDAGARLSALAAMTTHSLPALRAYLDGEHLLRSGRPAAALAALQTAVALDSTFGLAWYRLARAAGWIGPVELNEEAAARAVRFGAALPERTRSLVTAYRVFRTGDAVEAERLYATILARYPEDMETLELIGETRFHNNPFLGRPIAEAREPLERALAMDPDNRELMVHLMDLSAADGRTATLESLTARYVATEPDGETPTPLHAYAALRTLALEPPAEHEQAFSRLAAAGPDAIRDALVRVAPQLRDPVLNDRLATMLTEPAYAPDVRAFGHLHRAWFAVAGGRWRAAEPHWREAASIQPAWALVNRVLAAVLPHSPVSPDELSALRGRVTAWTPGAAMLENGLHDGDLEVVREYLLGLIAWRAADAAALARAVANLSGFAAASAASAGSAAARENVRTPDLALALASTLRALDLWREEQPADALAALDRARLRIPFHRRAGSPMLEQHFNRFIRAEILRTHGADGSQPADQEALRWYASLEDGYFHWGTPFVGPALLGAAEIHERHGAIERAIAAYERFLALWSDADPELDAWSELARERLDRVRRASIRP